MLFGNCKTLCGKWLMVSSVAQALWRTGIRRRRGYDGNGSQETSFFGASSANNTHVLLQVYQATTRDR